MNKPCRGGHGGVVEQRQQADAYRWYEFAPDVVESASSALAAALPGGGSWSALTAGAALLGLVALQMK
jgi:hypothetical protein